MSRRAIFAIAHADFLERVRGYGFGVTMVLAVFLGYAAATGKILLALGGYRGVYTSGWIGTMMALVTTTFVSLIGFYVVKNTLDRDRRTGVGQILATTPLSRPTYALGKTISNFAVLATIVLVLALAAVVMQVFVREDPHMDFWALLSPFLLVALPAMALTAALAVLFEVLPVLRGSVGNAIWFFIWSFGMAMAPATGIRWLDPTGLWTVARSMMAAAHSAIPAYKGGFSLAITGRTAVLARSLHWQGMPWTAEQVTLRLVWVGLAIGLAFLAAIFFDRFDPARSRETAQDRLSKRARLLLDPAVPTARPVPVGQHERSFHVTAPAVYAARHRFAHLWLAELRLAMKGYPWWWYVVAAGLLVAQFVAPLRIARGPLLATAWIWPVLVWSAMGTRESRYGTSPLLFSSAGVLWWQFPACLLAGIAIAAVCGCGAAVRLLVVGNQPGLLAWTAGALFLPALALALGVLTGSSKFFEALCTVLWYVGPMNHVPGLDYTGASNGAHEVQYAAIYLALAGGLCLAAFARRARQLSVS